MLSASCYVRFVTVTTDDRPTKWSDVTSRVSAMSMRARALSVGVAVILLAALAIVVTRGGENSSFTPKGDAEEILGADDPRGNPHILLPDAFNPTVNTKKEVPEEYKGDASGSLTVKSAKFVDGNGPYVLQWKVKVGKYEKVKCNNCLLIAPRLRKLLAEILKLDAAGSIESIQGYDPSRTVAADYLGNGWQMQIIMGNSSNAYKDGDAIAQWLLTNSKDNAVQSVLWQNLLYSSEECGNDLSSVPPVEAYSQAVGNNDAERADAGIDRVIVSSPEYTPILEDRDGAQFIAGWKTAKCA